jgi:uncharacterized RDD family membrane protein YckC
VSYEDRMQIATPEGVTLEVVLAGAGSRAAAALVDLIIQVVGAGILSGLVLLGVALLGWPLGVAAAVDAVIVFLVLFGYNIAFEVLRSGRTIGKQLNGLRVLRDDGGPISFTASAIRNIVRLVDVFVLLGVPALLSVLLTRHNQRLGDLAAGTIVARERVGDRPPKQTAYSALGRPQLPVDVHPELWDVAGLSRDELVAARAFLDRRLVLTWDGRRRLGELLAGSMRGKVPVDTRTLDDETFLAAVVEARDVRT